MVTAEVLQCLELYKSMADHMIAEPRRLTAARTDARNLLEADLPIVMRARCHWVLAQGPSEVFREYEITQEAVSTAIEHAQEAVNILTEAKEHVERSGVQLDTNFPFRQEYVSFLQRPVELALADHLSSEISILPKVNSTLQRGISG